MLNEIICDKFYEKKISFHKGLNVILGDELGSNSIGILVHDSVLLKQIEDVAVEKILEMYTMCKKQIFVALDKASSYSKKSQEILSEKKVLQLEPNGKELFGKSWSRK